MGLTWNKQLDKVTDDAYRASWTCRRNYGVGSPYQATIGEDTVN
jgi:hypothetical protein